MPAAEADLRYQPLDDWTLYADASRGFRSGGFNQTGVGEAVTSPASATCSMSRFPTPSKSVPRQTSGTARQRLPRRFSTRV
jgi:outer membrane receptor protein involved in Fe transport